jgi:coenzyme PQQ precursor peptide PqqA
MEFIKGSHRAKKGGIAMEWVRPDFEEISLACEINSYAVATL